MLGFGVAKDDRGLHEKVETVVACEGQDFTPDQLAYLAEMANRVGFVLLPPRPGDPPQCSRIKVNIPMTRDVLLVRLRSAS